MTERILVTGGTGFVGARIVAALRPHAALTVATRAPERVTSRWPAGDVAAVAADLTQPATVTSLCEGVDCVVHCAGHAHGVSETDAEAGAAHEAITVTGTRALLQSASLAGVRRLLFVSSTKAFGEATGNRCLDETTPPAPDSAYGRAKARAERDVLAWGTVAGRHAVVLRLPLVYGRGSAGNLTRLIAGIERGWFPPLPRLVNRRSMVHVDDVAAAVALALAAERAAGQIYTVTDGQEYSTRAIFEAIHRALGREPPAWAVPEIVFRVAARAGDVLGRLAGRRMPLDSEAVEKLLGSACYRSEKIRTELGFASAHTLYECLPELCREARSGTLRSGSARNGP